MRGYIYVLSNPAFPGLLKIGRTADTPDGRMRQLNTTGVPGAFILEATFLVNDVEKVELDVHEALSSHRHTANREFFKADITFILKTIHPIICENLDSNESAKHTQNKLNHSLSSGEVSVLQVLVTLATSYGLDIYRIKDYCGGDPLSLEIALANLHSKKLVSRRAVNSDSNGPRWVANPKGVKLLADNCLIDEWMRQNSGA